MRDEDEEARMELTFLSSDGRSRQRMRAWSSTEAPLLVMIFS